MKCDKCGNDFEVNVSGVSYKWMAGNLASEKFLGSYTQYTYTDFVPVLTGMCLKCVDEFAETRRKEVKSKAPRGIRNGLIVLASSIPVAFISEDLAGMVGLVGLLITIEFIHNKR